ncbi:MAG: HAD family hydrolase [Candidatus Thermoplasmatota archaeon]|nr:HAD family hydrolase [Candidatus Thermoplasmatota archaeon]
MLTPAAVLFDMDGVLVDSFHAWLRALNAALRRYGHEPISEHEFRSTYWGHDLYENLRRLGIDDQVGAFCLTIFGDYVGGITIFPGTRETLRTLDGYPTALVTNTPRGCVDSILGHFDIDIFFDAIVTPDDVEQGKPDPGMLLEACSRLNVEPADAVFVGDTDSDIRAGRAAGCTVIGVQVAADLTIDSVTELPSLLQTQQ